MYNTGFFVIGMVYGMCRTTQEYQEKYGWFEEETHSGVKSLNRKMDYGEVLTPRWLVEMMLDDTPTSGDIPSKVFEPCCGEGAFITCVLRRKLNKATTYSEKIQSCQTCYGVDIQYDNVQRCRQKMVGIAVSFGVDPYEAAFIFARNIVHGDMLFFPMIIRFYDWETDTWTTLEQMMESKDGD